MSCSPATPATGQGTLFHQAHLLLGDWARGLTLKLGDAFRGALIAILPPDAFIGLGLLIALKNLIDQRARERTKRRAARQPASAESPPAGSATA